MSTNANIEKWIEVVLTYLFNICWDFTMALAWGAAVGHFALGWPYYKGLFLAFGSIRLARYLNAELRKNGGL